MATLQVFIWLKPYDILGETLPSSLSKPQRAKKVPDWISNPNLGGYEGAVGSATKDEGNYNKQRQLAIKIAQAELAARKRIMIESELRIEKKLTKKGLLENFSSSIQSVTKQKVKELLENTIVKEEWLSPNIGKLFVWVVIEEPTKKGLITEAFKRKTSGLVKNVKANGSCAIDDMSAEQCWFIAQQRARAAAIEKAAGLEVSSYTLVTNFKLSANLIKTYSSGYIINEKVESRAFESSYKNSSAKPIPEYNVKIVADVYIPEKKTNLLGLTVKLNNTTFRAGEKAIVEINTKKEARVAIFNFRADDKVVMLFPNEYENSNLIAGGNTFKYPSESSIVSLKLQNFQNNNKDAEAFFVVAMDSGNERAFLKMFKPMDLMQFADFYKKYIDIANNCEDAILPYEVVSK